MREAIQLSPSDARRVPWKNGRGVTEELALWPTSSSFERADFEWRISKATIDEDGPFSTFPGFDRILVVTSGAGLSLTHGGAAPRARLRRFEPYLFSGDWPTRAELAGGMAADFNVIFRRGSCRANVEVLTLGRRRVRETIAAAHAFVHVTAGDAALRVTGEEDPFALDSGASLWVRGASPEDELDILGRSDDCTVLLVRIGLASRESERHPRS